MDGLLSSDIWAKIIVQLFSLKIPHAMSSVQSLDKQIGYLKNGKQADKKKG